MVGIIYCVYIIIYYIYIVYIVNRFSYIYYIYIVNRFNRFSCWYFHIWLWKTTIVTYSHYHIRKINYKQTVVQQLVYWRIDMGALRITNPEPHCLVVCRMIFLFEIAIAGFHGRFKLYMCMARKRVRMGPAICWLVRKASLFGGAQESWAISSTRIPCLCIKLGGVTWKTRIIHDFKVQHFTSEKLHSWRETHGLRSFLIVVYFNS